MQRSSVDLPEPEAPIRATRLVLGDVEVDAVQDLALAEGLGHAADLEHGRTPPATHRTPPAPPMRSTSRASGIVIAR